MEIMLTVLAVVSCICRLTLANVAIHYRLTRSSILTRTTVAVVDHCEQKEHILCVIIARRVTNHMHYAASDKGLGPMLR